MEDGDDMAAHAITQYQTIVARAVDLKDAAVITVGSVQAGEANNVIPGEALLKLSLRWFKPEVRQTMISGIQAVNQAIARTYGMPEDQLPKLITKGGTTPMVNDSAVIDRINPQLVNLVGADKLITQFEGTTGSEDAHLLKGDNPNIQFGFIFSGGCRTIALCQSQSRGQNGSLLQPQQQLSSRSRCDPVWDQGRICHDDGIAEKLRIMVAILAGLHLLDCESYFSGDVLQIVHCLAIEDSPHAALRIRSSSRSWSSVRCVDRFVP